MADFKTGFLRAIKAAQEDDSRFGENRLNSGDVKAFFPEPAPETNPSDREPRTRSEQRFLASKRDWIGDQSE